MGNLKFNLKKFSLFLLTIVLSFSLASCNKNDKDKKNEKSDISVEEKSSNNKKDKKESKEKSNIDNEKKEEVNASPQPTNEPVAQQAPAQAVPTEQPAAQAAPEQPAQAQPAAPATQPVAQQAPDQGGNQEGCLNEAIFN